MQRRWVLWLLALTVALGPIGLASAAVAFRAVDPHRGFASALLPDVSRQVIPANTRMVVPAGRRPRAYWLVRDGNTWHAYADRATTWRECTLVWAQNAASFQDWCVGGDWDTSGRALSGTAARNLDEFTVTEELGGIIAVDLSHLRSGAPAPWVVFDQFLAALRRRDAATAWSLVHPDLRTPEALGRFKLAVAQEPVPRRVIGVTRRRGSTAAGWEGPVVETTVTWDNGDHQNFRLAPDRNGNWYVLWTP